MNQAEPTEVEQTRPSLATKLGMVSFFNDCSSEAIGRVLPLVLTSGLGASPAFVGFIEGLAESVSVLIRGFSGWLSDRMTSRKPLVVIGYTLSLFARVLLLFVNIPSLLGASRVFDRTGKGLRTAPRDAMIADAVVQNNAGHSFGVLRLLDTLGAVVGLAVILFMGVGSEKLTLDDFRQVVAISIPFGCVAVLVLALWVPRIPTATRAKKYLSLHIPKKIRVYLAILFVFVLSNSSDAFLVLRAQELGFAFWEILVILIVFNIVAAGLSVPIGRLSDKYGRMPFLFVGWALYAVTYAAMAFAVQKAFFAGAFIVYGAFYGFTEGIEKALLADLLPPDERGTGYGALQTVMGVAMFPASLMTGFIMTSYGSTIALLVSAGIAAIATVLLGLMWKSLRRTQLDNETP